MAGVVVNKVYKQRYFELQALPLSLESTGIVFLF